MSHRARGAVVLLLAGSVGNTIGGILQCSGKTPPRAGRDNTVAGTTQEQCTGL